MARRYIIHRVGGDYLQHSNGFSYSRGRFYQWTDSLQHARLFTRLQDAEGVKVLILTANPTIKPEELVIKEVTIKHA